MQKANPQQPQLASCQGRGWGWGWGLGVGAGVRVQVRGKVRAGVKVRGWVREATLLTELPSPSMRKAGGRARVQIEVRGKVRVGRSHRAAFAIDEKGGVLTAGAPDHIAHRV